MVRSLCAWPSQGCTRTHNNSVRCVLPVLLKFTERPTSASVLCVMSDENIVCTPADEQRLWDACCRAAEVEGGSSTGATLYQRVYRQVGNRKLSVRGVNARIALLLAGSVQRAVHLDDDDTQTQAFDVAGGGHAGGCSSHAASHRAQHASDSRVECRERCDAAALKRHLRDIYGSSDQESGNATLLSYLRDLRAPGGGHLPRPPHEDEVLESDRHQLFKLCAQKVTAGDMCLHVRGLRGMVGRLLKHLLISFHRAKISMRCLRQ